MQRQIKLRIWSKKHNCFFNQETSTWIREHEMGRGFSLCFPMFKDGNYLLQNDDDFTIQQWTGLQDKNGKDIYEGDIVSWEHPMEDVGEVKYMTKSIGSDTAYFAVSTKRLGDCHFQNDDSYKVIGNIFENPELLNDRMSATDKHSTQGATANAVASSSMVCAERRKKPSRYLSARNADGWAWVKCGRKAVTVNKFGKPLCRQCSHT